MKKRKYLLFTLLIISLAVFTTACGEKTKIENPIEGVSYKDTRKYFKEDLSFNFSKDENQDGKDIAVGHSPSNQGNSIFTMVGSKSSDEVESLNFVYFLDEVVDLGKQDYLLNSIYLGLMLDQVPDFDDARIWIHENIQDIINEEPIIVDESKNFNGRQVDIKVSHDGYRKLDLTISSK